MGAGAVTVIINATNIRKDEDRAIRMKEKEILRRANIIKNRQLKQLLRGF